MLSSCLIALVPLAAADTDGFGMRVQGIADLDGDGTDDLVVADAGYRGNGAIWTISGKDGRRLGTALGDEQHKWLGGSYFVTGEEICACVTTSEGPALQFLSGKSLKPLRVSEKVGRAQGFYSWVEPAGDLDGDGVVDAAMCLVPGDLKRSFLELVSGKTGKRLRTIEIGLSRSTHSSAVASLGDLDGDGVPEIGVGTGHCFPADQSYRVHVLSGKTGQTLGELLGHEGQPGFGAALGAVGDLDGDGVGDIVLVDDAQGSVLLYSGKTRGFLRALAGTWPLPGSMELGNVTRLRDLDGDGVRDFGFTLDTFLEGQARIYSGKSGEWIRTHDVKSFPNGDGYPAFMADVGDLDHDGKGDYAVGTSHHLAGNGNSSVTAFSGATGRALFVVDRRKIAGD